MVLSLSNAMMKHLKVFGAWCLTGICYEWTRQSVPFCCMKSRDKVPQRLADSEHDHLKWDIRDLIFYAINHTLEIIRMGRHRFLSTKA